MQLPPSARALTGFLATCTVVATLKDDRLWVIGLVVVLLIAIGLFLYWYVHLTPIRRADVLALIRAMRQR